MWRKQTEIVNEFIEAGTTAIISYAGGGNRNFNTLFGFTAKDLARDYQGPFSSVRISDPKMMLINWEQVEQLDKPVLKSRPTEVTYFKLNNELNCPVDGKIPSQQGLGSRACFLLRINVKLNVFFYSLGED